MVATPFEAGSASPAPRWIQPALAVAAAGPTVVAAALQPALILDDLEFAARARFEGWAGFVDEMGYRPGQGLVHAMQFNVLGDRPTLQLLVLAIGNAASALLLWRLLALVVPLHLALATAGAFALVPNHSSLRFWISTLPNHIAMCLLLGAALVAARQIRRTRTGEDDDHRGPATAAVAGLSVLSILTYEATIVLVALVVLAMASTATTRRNRLVVPAATLGLFAGAGAFVAARSPRAGSSTLLAKPIDAVVNHGLAVAPQPFDVIGALVVAAAAIWAVVTFAVQRGSSPIEAIAGTTGVVVALAGLAPFAVAGFNTQAHGVLDRAHFFPTLGTALVIGAAGCAAVRAAPTLPLRPLLVPIMGLTLIGLVADMQPYRRASNEQREAAMALQHLGRPAEGEVRVVSPSTAGGVGWGFYDQQLWATWQLANDVESAPTWLRFGDADSLDSVPTKLAFLDIQNGELVTVEP